MRLSFRGVWSPGDSRAGAVRADARGRGCGRACRRRGPGLGHGRAPAARPTPSSSTSQARSRAARATRRPAPTPIAISSRSSPTGGLGAQRRAGLRPQRPHRRQPAGRPRHGRVDRSPHFADGSQAGHRDVRRSGHRSRRRRRGRLGAPGGQFDIPGIGWGRRTNGGSCARTGPTAAPRWRSTSISADWHNLPAGTEILLGYSDAAATGHERSCGAPDKARDARRPMRRSATAAASEPIRPSSAPRRPRACERRHADGLGRRHHADRHRGAAARRVHAHAADRSVTQRSSPRPGTSSRSPAAPTTVTTSATSAATRASTRAATSSPPRARRSWPCSPACSTTWAGTASAAGGSGSRT